MKTRFAAPRVLIGAPITAAVAGAGLRRKTPLLRLASSRAACRFIHVLFLLLPLALVLVCGPVRAGDGFLEPEAAFKFSARMVDAKTAEVTYTIANGYYMYRERFNFKSAAAQLGTASYPPGKVKFDETFQKQVETFRHAVSIRIPVEAHGPFSLSATGQGCADSGLCYSPMESTVQLDPAVISPAAAAPAASAADTDVGRIGKALEAGKLAAILPLFFLLGLGLAFTPCVLPMVPILSSIIVGEGKRASRGRGLLLSATYALGMALVYTALGVAAGLAGEGLAATLQNPWVLGFFAAVMALLSLSMFDLFQLQMPASVQTWLNAASERQRAGKLAGVFAMGAMSALVVGPCVAAPLAGTLIFISHTHNVAVGGSALFAMAIGMSTPLLLIGASAGALLPRAGAWMGAVKRFFGVAMLATALWMVGPVAPPAFQMMAWGALAIGYATYLFRARGSRWPARVIALLLAGLGVAQIAGIASGGRDFMHPLENFGEGQAASLPHFTPVASIGELDANLARSAGQPVMLDFYADWCVSCKEMESSTFRDAAVRSRLDRTLLLRADVTNNNADDKALLKRFGLFGPPGIVFFDGKGQEVVNARVIGYQGPNDFLDSLSRAQNDTSQAPAP
jgi:thiol:disulfide interchange protein DsbD